MSTTIVLLILALATKSLYVPLNRRKSRFYWKIPLDNRLPLIPIFVVPYVLYHLGVFASYIILWNTKYINQFLLGIIVSYAIGTAFWYLFPNGVSRPTLIHDTHLYKLLKFIYKHDGDTNGFPSAHVFMSLICGHFLSFAFPAAALIIWPLVICVILSTIFTKQHYIVDMLGGMAVYVLTLYIVSAIF